MNDKLILELEIFNEQYNKLDDIYHQLAKYSGISDTAFWIIYAIQENKKSYTQRDICKLWSCSKQTINSALKNLEKEELIKLEYITNNKDKQILLTEKGHKYIEKNIIPLMQAEQEAFGRLKETERKQLLNIMEKYIIQLYKETDAIIKKGEKSV